MNSYNDNDDILAVKFHIGIVCVSEIVFSWDGRKLDYQARGRELDYLTIK